jgi:hypothetical protein
VGGIIAYLLFFLAGLGFGYAAEGKWRWLPLLFPLALGAWAIFKYGPDASGSWSARQSMRAAPPATSILVTPSHAHAG